MTNVFAAVASENGLNPLSENPCRLLDFALLTLTDGQSHTLETGDREVVAVVLGGKASFAVSNAGSNATGAQTFAEVGGRATVFDGPPHAVYLPNESRATITGAGAVEIALCSAPSDAGGDAYLITPEQVTSGTWGARNYTRYFNQILTEAGQPDLPARRLIVGETFTPSGNWSTYPAHKHEVDNLPEEAYHEEMYFFRVTPDDGFGITRFYHEESDAGSEDAVNFTVRNNTILMLPDGYHTYVGAPGFDSYYLWFLAGEHRQQAVVEDAVQRRAVDALG